VTTPRAAHRWLYAGPALVVLHLLLLALLHARPGLPAVVLWHAGPAALTVVAILVMAYGVYQSTRCPVAWTRGPVAGYACLLAVTLMPVVAYRTYPSSRDGRPSDVRFRLPLDGPVLVRWGGATREVNYHVFAPAERWAYDLYVTNDGRTHRTDGADVSDYFGYGQPVLAPAAGTVRALIDGLPDTPIGGRVKWQNSCGNHVLIDVAPGEFLFLCHLIAGSVVVRTGEAVLAGQEVGRLGNSGRSREPHVHVHLQTTPDANLSEGIPLFFHEYRYDDAIVERGMPTGGRSPQIVEHAGSPGRPAARAGRSGLPHAARGQTYEGPRYVRRQHAPIAQAFRPAHRPGFNAPATRRALTRALRDASRRRRR